MCKCLCLVVLGFVLLHSERVYAQTALTGRTVDQTGKPVGFANVLILNPVDSSLIQGDLSDENGHFSIMAEAGTKIIISTSFIGYTLNYSPVFEVPEAKSYQLEDFILSEGLALDAIQVVARKPLYEQKIDRMVVNVANSVTSSGATALEVLERSPGVVVNRQSNGISLLGKEGIVIMINGKISYQPVEGIVQMLSGMSSDNIEKIELITSPPANLDAEGNAGYINIVLLQRPDLGFNANTAVTAGYGNGETGSANLNFNYRKNKLNLFGNYSYFLKAQYQEFFNYRKIKQLGNETEDITLSERYPTQRNHNARLGFDYMVSDKTTIGILAAAYDTKWTMDADNFSSTLENGLRQDSIFIFNEERNQWKHIMGNFNIEHQFSDTEKLNFNLDRLYYEDQNPVLYDIEFFDDSDVLKSSTRTRSDKYTPINISVIQIDYEKSLSDLISIQTGVKAAVSEFTNDILVEDYNGDQWIKSNQFSNESDLSEKVYAAYFSTDYLIDESQQLKIGLRYEFTDSELNTVKEGTVVDREFGQFFPTIFYSKQLNDNQSFGISYNRRITRPTFNQMAPFTIFLNPSTIYIGNAGLQPATSNNIKVDYRLNSYNLSIQFSQEDSTIARFQDRYLAVEGFQAVEPTNLSRTNVISGSLSVPVYVTNNWEMQNNLVAQWQESQSYYEGSYLIFSDFNFNINSTQSFLLGESYTLEISGFYNSGNLNGRALLNAFGGLNFGLQKRFENGSNLRFAVTDILESIKWDINTNLIEEGLSVNRKYDFSNRTFALSYSTNFGNKKLKAMRERTTGSEEERSRVN